MERCTPFKIFNLLLVFCVVNFFIYRIFIGSTPTMFNFRSVHASNSTPTRALLGHTTGAPGNSSHPTPSPPVVVPGNTTSTKASTKPPTSSPKAAAVTDKRSSEKPKTTSAVATKGDNKTANSSTPASSKSKDGQALCPLVPPGLNGALATYTDAPATYEEIAKDNEGLRPGGLYSPPDCTARHRVAIVIPFRDRDHHLKVLLKNLHPILRRQQLEYGIYVVDQALPGRFNRAMLMNIGFKEAMDRHDYQCAIFHDVDLIPENDKNIYSCPDMPRHMSAAIDKFRYKLPYANIFGGASAMSKEHFKKVNGFSNSYFGWGGEDDDMAIRIGSSGLKITRYPMAIARYKMIKHTHEKLNQQNPKRFALLKNVKDRMPKDGLNSLKYDLQKVEEAPTHTRLQVYIDENNFSTM